MLDAIDYNPDVLSCLANLSNDEVFTPPEIVNKILDLLPQEIWTDETTTFLDPGCKSGVFLREIAKRLDKGLAIKIPDLQDRFNHIMKNQLYGLAITELTALLARRSLYCSKKANGKYSICTQFDTELGNVKFDFIEHTWVDGNCMYCGATKKKYDRDDNLETHAYQLIHEKNPEEIFNMRFDVIVGNPPYQLSDSGHGASAGAIYPQFVMSAMRMEPRFISMIIPSRWFAGGGRGLPQFRELMLNDNRIRSIHDYPSASDCFPGVEIKGGVNYFLWERDNPGLCNVVTHKSGKVISEAERSLKQEGVDTFVRYNESVRILKKVLEQNEGSFSELVSANDPFGFDVREKGSQKRVRPKLKKNKFIGGVPYYYNGWRRDGIRYVDGDLIRKNMEWIDKPKILVPKAVGGGDPGTDRIKAFVPEKLSCCSETYIVIGPFKSQAEIKNVLAYIETKFFHFLVSLIKNTQESRRNVYQFVPKQNFKENWTDEKLYKKYNINVIYIVFFI
jgi:site-specific DNA-methyltransferase (adenine-specific)